jgi:tetratricopeptide (TPR) repeat protein
VPQTYFERTIRDNAAEYVLAPVDWDNVMSYEFKMKESRRMQFVQQWKEGGLALYCVYPSLLSIKNESSIIDTTYPGDLLRLGRFHLNKGEYKQAQNYFGKALKKFQNNNEVLYNLVLATAFQENEPEANRYYRLLSNSAQALSFLTPGQIQLDLLGRLQSARNSEAKERKSIDVIAIARDYWGLGYPVRAYELAKEALQTDSSYFFGLLWGWYFAVQFNEDVQAKKYLLLLSKIDSSNPLVKTITAIMVKRDSLKLPLKPAIRSELHLAIAKGYESAGLPETAIDEAIASLCAYQKNLSTRMFLAQLFEMKKAYRAAKIIQTRGITCK